MKLSVCFRLFGVYLEHQDALTVFQIRQISVPIFPQLKVEYKKVLLSV